MAALVTAVRRIPWARLLIIARWVYERGKTNLTASERSELGTLLRKSKADPRKLTARDRTRVRNLVYKGFTGRKP